MSIRARFYLAMFFAFIAIGAHLLADHFDLYWIYRQIDIPIHMLGGVMAGTFVLTGLRFFGLKETLKYTLYGAFAIGAGWEILEFIYKVQAIDTYYYFDTAKDLLDDIIGGSIALWIWRKLPEPKEDLQNK